MKKINLITLYYVNLKLPFLILNEKYSHTESNITNFTFSLLDKKDADRSKTDDNKHYTDCSN